MPNKTPAPVVSLTDEQSAILRDMWDAGSHTFYTEAFTHRIEQAFGVKVGYWEVANTNEPKGLTVSGKGRRTKVYGSSSHGVACRLCDHFGIPYESTIGRGSQFRAALGALTDAARLTFDND